MGSFWAELKRRKVFNVAIVYGIASWLLIQIADVGVPALLLPEWVISLVTFLLILGFPIALILAWAYDLTPKGIELTPKLEELPEPAPAALAPAGSDIEKAEAAEQAPEVPPAPDPELASVAVTPFLNLTPASEFGFLADAVAMDIHSSLSRVHQLRVASRQSSFAMKQSEKDVKDIARELNVQYVISGSVAHAGEKIRLVAEVDDAKQGTLLWSERYEVNADEILNLQQNIVESIVSAFGGERLRTEIEQATRVAPTNLDAWGLVQKARGYLLDYSPNTITQAVGMLQDAVKLDPDYAGAQAALGLLIAEKALNGMSEDPEADRATAIEAIELAESRAPRDPLVLRTAGCVWAYSGDYHRSESLLRRSLAIAPSDLGAWGYLGWPLVAKGDPDSLQELQQILDRLLSIAPRHPGHAYWLFHKSVACSLEDECEAAVEHVVNSTREQPQFALAWMHYANVLGRLGRMDEARRASDQCMRVNTAVTPGFYCALMSVLTDQEDVVDRRTSGLHAATLLD
jgi:TolB-like protein/Tfp pilus assembly protein PilF